MKQERTELQAMLDLAKSKETTHKVVTDVAERFSRIGIAEMRAAIQARLDKLLRAKWMPRGRRQAAEVLGWTRWTRSCRPQRKLGRSKGISGFTGASALAGILDASVSYLEGSPLLDEVEMTKRAGYSSP